jgi:1-acyl-sn-glycerol-3-phosphate acyltransferase
MMWLRVTLKAVGFCAVTGGLYLLWLAVFPLVCASPARSRRWRQFIFRSWARAMMALLAIKVDVRGVAPKPPFLLVSNHLSYVDVVVFAAHVDAVFVAKSEVARWPALGVMCRGMGTIFVDRASRRDLARVNGLIERATGEGQGVVVFPEGTSTAGDAVLPFKPGLLEAAARGGRAVSYASVSYRTPGDEAPAREAVCWWGEITFLPHLIGLFRLSEVNATLIFGGEVRASDRKILAERLRAAVREIFIPVTKSVGVSAAASTSTRHGEQREDVCEMTCQPNP